MRCATFAVAGEKEHVALSDQFFRTGAIENDTAVGEAADGESHSRRNVCFDDTGDDIDRWALRGHDEVNAHRTSFLSDASDALRRRERPPS